jgi:ABC-type lipoprotein export system ATPase subunit
MTVLVAERLTKRFGDGPLAVTAVEDANLTVAAGEVVVVRGPSGSGKTTLLSMLAGLLAPTSGRVEVAGVHVDAARRAHPAWRLETIGFVFQSFNLLADLSVVENVALPLRLAGLRRQVAAARARDLVARLGLEDRAGALPGVLSGGERQRVSIARALAAEPAVVLADEPTASLDRRQGEVAVTLLTSLVRTEGRGCVIVTHDERVEAWGDRVLHIEDGHMTSGT